ncbi:MAG TPA: CBS domain-containing protein, partial [Micromonosporaceae bacterium]
DVVDALAARTVSAVPVVDPDGRVLGVVSEADLLHKMEFAGADSHMHLLERRRRRDARTKAGAETASELMSAPAVLIGPDEPLMAAAKLMDEERVKRLPVVDGEGRLVGIVSRRDLLRVYLREDAELRREVIDDVLVHTMWMDPESLTVTVHRGVVILAGTVDRRSTMVLLIRLVEAVPGVVEVVSELTYHYDDTADLHRRNLMGATVKETVP